MVLGLPALTTDLIRRNAAIRQGLASACTAQDARDWVACFGSMPVPADALLTDEIPALAFGAMPRHAHAELLGFNVAHGSAAGRAFVAALMPRIAYGEDRQASEACTLGLSAEGLRALDAVDDGDLATFPVAFQQGMHAPARARANGDADTADPARWCWGGPDAMVHILVLHHAADEAALDAAVDATLEAAWGRVARITMRRFAPLVDGRMREGFGFRDGISQPAMRGTRRARAVGAQDVVAPGELVLGYPDEIGRRPPTPTLAAPRDPGRRLADVGLDPDRQRPAFGAAALAARRDLGANGTYLVVRDLLQDVTAFDAWLADTARKLDDPAAPSDPDRRRQWLAAKLVGRWADGTSLVRHPDEPGSGWHGTRRTRPDNAFLYGAEDAAGLRCPMGAHVRRAIRAMGSSPVRRISRRWCARTGCCASAAPIGRPTASRA